MAGMPYRVYGGLRFFERQEIKDALAYLDKYGVTYPSGPDLGDKISQSYGITGVPETFFIDREGNIIHVQIGPVEHNQFYGLLDKLVATTEQGS